VDAIAEKFIREREGLGNAGRRSNGSRPAANQVQNLLMISTVCGYTKRTPKEKLAELTPLVNDASMQVKKIAEEELPG